MKRAWSRRDLLKLSCAVVPALAAGLVRIPVRAMTAAGGGACEAAPGTPPKRQLRGVWIATVSNIDWPSQPGLSIADQQAQLRSLLDACVNARLNSVYFQVRSVADAMYPTSYAPWSQALTGTQGQDPGYDPLAFAVAEAHRRNLELHAWMNPYRVSLQPDASKLAPDNPARLHPDWVVTYGQQIWFDPGIPDARRFLEDSILDPLSRYDVDGLHFDDYYYPYPVAGITFPDDASFALYGSGFSDRGDWRRHNVNLLISELSQRVHALKPWLKFGAAPFGVWRNQSTDPTGSATQAGAQDYDDLYADTRTWIRQEWLDYIAPEIYWAIGFAPAAYDVLVPWWSGEVAGTDVSLLIGEAAYKVGTSTQSPGWSTTGELADHLALDIGYPAVSGNILYNMSAVVANRLGFLTQLEAGAYRYPALVPVMPSLGGHAPAPAQIVSARRTDQGTVLTWTPRPGPSTPASFAVYRFPGQTRPPECDFDDPRNLVTAVRANAAQGPQTYVDAGLASGPQTYCVTALDRLHHESPAGNPAVVA